MSEMAKAARAANKAKAARMSKGDPKAKVDASSWSPPEMLEADKKTGLRPVSRRAYKRGGKVEGVKAEARADRKARKTGGRTEATEIANAKVNRNVKDANEEKFGSYHVGGYAKGGRTSKMSYATHEWDEGREKWIPKKKAKPIRSEDEIGYMGPSSVDDPDKFRPGNMKRGGKAEKRPGKQYGGTPPMPRPKPKPPAISLGMDEDMTRMPEPSKEYSERQKINAGEMEPDYEPRKRGGKAEKWEGSKKDEEQDRKLAKKRGMSMKEWEASEADKKHDKQQSMKGLKRGGHVEGCMCKMCGGRAGRATGGRTGDGFYQGTRPTGGRIAKAGGGLIEGLLGGVGAAAAKKMERKSGGRTKAKGKTNINIVINAGKKDDTDMGMGMPPLPPMMGKPALPPPPPGTPLGGVGAAGGAGAPPMPPMPAGAPPAALMGRKAGGRVYRSYKDMDAGAGSGLGRLEKTEIEEKKRTGRKAGGKVYRSYKDMDAGAGSGEGRLEKTEIQRNKRR